MVEPEIGGVGDAVGAASVDADVLETIEEPLFEAVAEGGDPTKATEGFNGAPDLVESGRRRRSFDSAPSALRSG